MVKNMVIFKQFYGIFNGLKPFITDKLAPDLNILDLNNVYRLFVYERPLPQGRGLPAIDDDGNSIPWPEPKIIRDSSDDECERTIQEVFSKMESTPVIDAIKKKYFTMMGRLAAAFNELVDNQKVITRGGEHASIKSKVLSEGIAKSLNKRV